MSGQAVTVAILAGGASSRLGGRDKGLEPLHGTTLIERVCRAVRKAAGQGTAVDLLIVANRHPDRYALHAPTIADDPRNGSGPLAGVASALAVIRTPWLLTLPVDCPDPPPALLDRLLQSTSTVACSVAHDGEWRQPLFALYRGDLADSARRAAVAGQGPSAWQEAIDAIDVDFSDQRLHFANLNCAADFDSYREIRRGHD